MPHLVHKDHNGQHEQERHDRAEDNPIHTHDRIDDIAQQECLEFCGRPRWQEVAIANRAIP